MIGAARNALKRQIGQPGVDLPDRRSYEDLSALALRAFEDMESSLEKNRLEFEKQGIRSHGLFERLLGFQLVLSAAVLAQRPAGYKGGIPQGAADEIWAERYIMSLLAHNVNYLHPAAQALEQNLMTAYEALMRPVDESIPKSFYIMAHPETTKNFMLMEMYSAWRSPNPDQKYLDSIDEFLKSPQPQKLLGGLQITAKTFGKFCKSHSNKRVRARIYNAETLEAQETLYARLSYSSHANMLRPFQVQRDPGLSGRLMDLTTVLSFFNLFLTANSQHRHLKRRGPWEQAEQFVKSAAEDMGVRYSLANMYPDEAEYTKKLPIQLEPLK